MKYLKSYNKLSESINWHESTDKFTQTIEDLLRDFSDSDFEVEVVLLDKLDMKNDEFIEGVKDLVITIEGGYGYKKYLPIINNIENLISMDNFITDEGWKLEDIELYYSMVDSDEIPQLTTKYETTEFNSLIEMIKSKENIKFHSLDFCYYKKIK